MKSIRSGRGLGDSIYLQSIVRHLAVPMWVYSDFPDLFNGMGVKVRPHQRKADLVAHYVSRKAQKGTSQFVDMCMSAGIKGPVDLVLNWPEPPKPARPIVCVQLPRSPMGRTDGFGSELLPNCKIIQRAINRIKDRATIVQIGAGEPLFRFSGIDLDLANKTTIPGLLDVAASASAFIGYPSFIVPLAEALNKPSLIVWSCRGLRSPDPFINRIMPAKVLHKPSSRFVLDNCTDDQLAEAVDGLL